MKQQERSLKIIAFLFALIMSFSLLATPILAAAEQAVNERIKQLIVYYKEYQEKAETDIERLLSEMADINKDTAKVWEQIMDFWSYVNTDMTVNTTVPTDLPTDNSVAIVILGYALNSDGSMKSELVGRLQTGLAMANAYPNAYVVVTGGKPTNGITEGDAMAAWLMDNGLDKDRLIVENQALDTVGNAKNTYAILSANYPEVKSLVMVTSDYHIPRGCILFYSRCLLSAYEAGDDTPLELISNCGYVAETSGYESISLQASGVSTVSGLGISGVEVKLSQLSQLDVALNTSHTAGSALDITASATYHNGYTRNVTDKITVSGFDPNGTADQVITVSYTENGITVSGSMSLSDKKATFFSTKHLENLVTEADKIVETKYTAASYAEFKSALDEAKKVLAKQSPSLAEVGHAYDALNTKLGALVLLPNISYKKPVTSNSFGSYPPTNINDGAKSTSNYWGTLTATGGNLAAKDAWLIIDLDGLYNVEAVTVYPYWSGNRVYKYALYGSTDGEEWFKIGSQEDDAIATTAGFTHEISATVSYVKLQGISTYVPGRSDINNMHIIEMEVYGSEADNLALNKTVTSSGSDQSVSSSAGATSDKVNDGDRSTYWDGGKYSEEPHVTVDLGAIYNLDKINVISYWQSSRYYHYDVYTSIDGKDFTMVGSKTDNAKETILGTDFDLTDEQIYARYIKIVGLYNSANSAFHISEIRAYGKKPTNISYIGLQTGEKSIRFIGAVEQSAVSIYSKVDLEVTFTSESGAVSSFTCPTATVYKAMMYQGGVAVAVKGSTYADNLDENCVFDASYLFGYCIKDIPTGNYTVTITPTAYIGNNAITFTTATYQNITVATDGNVTITK